MSGERAGDWMQTYTGRAFWPLDPDPADVDVRDIAHALSLQCRYNGHVARFYSVAEHCLLVSRAVAPEHALWGLLHDATEAYMGDLIRPLKPFVPAYVEAERRLSDAICARFGLSPECPAEVKDADRRILHDERAELMPGPPPRPWTALDGVGPLRVSVFGLPPSVAESAYLARFAALAEVSA